MSCSHGHPLWSMISVLVVVTAMLGSQRPVSATSWALWGNPTANPRAVVRVPGGGDGVEDGLMITVLTSRLLRLELHSTISQSRSLAVWNRNLPVPTFQTHHNASHFILSTEHLEVTVPLAVSATPGKTLVSPTDQWENLRIRLLSPSLWSPSSVWSPSSSSEGNLLGTIRTLDKQNGVFSLNCSSPSMKNRHPYDEPEHCSMGLISRTGWAILDDSRGPLLRANSDHDKLHPQERIASPQRAHSSPSDRKDYWVHPRLDGKCLSRGEMVQDQIEPCQPLTWNPTSEANCTLNGCCWNEHFQSNLRCYTRSGNKDVYFFGHGLDYHAALKDFTSIAGRVPKPRRALLGVMWSLWNETAVTRNVHQQVDLLSKSGFPLDVYIFDMQWHIRPDWTGWTWARSNYVDPASLLAWLHHRNLTTAANVHDAEGVMPQELRYPEMAKANGYAHNETVPFAISNMTYANTLQDIMLEPLEEMGLDFWWTDWQQGMRGALTVQGLNPTFWLNHNRFMRWNAQGSRLRGAHLARYGGWGNHRYPVGFAGDYAQTWESLHMMPRFISTASNVAFAYWGLEMMQNSTPASNAHRELFTRVCQFGSMSPIYTNYGNKYMRDDLWALPSPFRESISSALVLRNRLLPYRYTLAHHTWESGIGMARPMYYDEHWRSIPRAYAVPNQYMIGDDVLFAPIVQSSCPPAAKDARPGEDCASNHTGNATLESIWLPPTPSSWVEMRSLQAFQSNQTLTNTSYSLDHIPLFIRGGAILPMLSLKDAATHGVANAFTPSSLQFHVYLDAQIESASTHVVEDDGRTLDYQDGLFTNLSISYVNGIRSGSGCVDVEWSLSGPSYVGEPTMRSYDVVLLRWDDAVDSKRPPTMVNGTFVKTWKYLDNRVWVTTKSAPLRKPQRLGVCV